MYPPVWLLINNINEKSGVCKSTHIFSVNLYVEHKLQEFQALNVYSNLVQCIWKYLFASEKKRFP
jgi:hypothetical protein